MAAPHPVDGEAPRTWWRWAPGLACCGAAVLVALLAPAPPPPHPASIDDLAAWQALVERESAARLQAIVDFPADRWSQEDAFGAFQHSHVTELSNRTGLRPQRIHRAFDEGLRHHWALPPGSERPRATVTPLQPRHTD